MSRKNKKLPTTNSLLLLFFSAILYEVLLFNLILIIYTIMKNINSQVLRKTFAVRFTLVRFVLARFVLAAILIPALLIGSAFTFGGSKLQAQAVQSSSKQGFFVGIAYLNGFKVDSSTKTTGVTNANIGLLSTTRTSYNNVSYSPITTSIEAYATSDYDDSPDAKAGIEALVVANCETGATSFDATDGTYRFSDVSSSLITFDVGTRDEVGNTRSDNSGTGTGTWTFDVCRNHFSSNGLTADDFADYTLPVGNTVQGSISTTDTDALTSTTTNKSDKISGIGLQFSFRWEKWRASLTHFTGSGGANELANTLVMADYFVNEDFFVGGGLASMKLTNGSASGSATSPAIQVGYKKNLTPNLFFNFGLTKYISGVSLESSTAPTTTPYTPDPTFKIDSTTTNSLTPEQTKEGGSVLIGLGFVVNPDGGLHNINIPPSKKQDRRTEVTQSGSRTVTYRETIETSTTTTTTEGTTETTTETEAELKAPLVISISFHLSF